MDKVDTLELVRRRANAPLEGCLTNEAQTFDIQLAAEVFSLGHRIFENTSRACELRSAGNSNVEHFQLCHRWSSLPYNSSITPIMRLEQVSLWFMWSVCCGLHTSQKRVALYNACVKVHRSRGFEEWSEPRSFKELVTLTAALLLLQYAACTQTTMTKLTLYSETSSPSLSPSLFGFPVLPLPEQEPLTQQMGGTQQAHDYLWRWKSYQIQHGLWQWNPLPRLEPNGEPGHITYIMACFAWYVEYYESVREGRAENHRSRNRAELFLSTLIKEVCNMRRPDVFCRMLSMERYVF
ncbi:hypothetical protein IF2G_10805 [Cordyceps javanica]|nr:hypothetical protein IF2G_10805 [Cordyceps javanica]